jgi:hypothetical protein
MGTANILNQNILALVRMSNNKVSQAKSLYPLFNSLKSGSSFNRLAFSLIGYTAPSFLLIRHSYNTIDGKTSKGIIGAFVNSPWKDELGYQGDNTTYLFTLLPRIKFLYSYKGNGDNNFLYLNTKKITNSKYKVGLGFGGVEFKECRLWIDDEMLDKSYSLPMDGTYPSGALSDGYEEKLTVGKHANPDRVHRGLGTGWRGRCQQARGLQADEAHDDTQLQENRQEKVPRGRVCQPSV